MTTQDFIKKTYNTSTYAGHDRHCSSVYTDRMGIVYSYGPHYPLAFHIAGLDFINDRGYSNTTSKHISWAKSAIRGYTTVELDMHTQIARDIVNTDNSDDLRLNAILLLLNERMNKLTDEMATKKRKDTWVYEDLERQKDLLQLNIMTVQGVL